MSKHEWAEKLQDHTPEALFIFSIEVIIMKDRASEALYAYLFTCHTHYTPNVPCHYPRIWSGQPKIDNRQHELIFCDTATIINKRNKIRSNLLGPGMA